MKKIGIQIKKDLVKYSPIVLFSFGSPRIFRISKKEDDKFKIIVDIETVDNSAISMEGHMQEEYYHEIVKTAKNVDMGIND